MGDEVACRDPDLVTILCIKILDEGDARRLVVRGFFNEVISLIGDDVIQERLMTRIDNELEKAGK
jgi:Fe-S cluster assembly protein SufD